MSRFTRKELNSAIYYNIWAAEEVFEQDSLPPSFLEQYHERICFGPGEEGFALATADFQEDSGLKIDGKLGTRTLGRILEAFSAAGKSPAKGFESPPALLDKRAKRDLVGHTVKFEGGNKENPYGSLNLDKEWEGAFDRPKRKNGTRIPPQDRSKEPHHRPHRASKYHPSGGFHVGLSYGAWQAAQEPGSLGSLLLFMYRAQGVLFKSVFGEDWGELLNVTTARNRRTGKFSARTRKVAGAYLWEEPWKGRFITASLHKVFQEAQQEWAARTYLDPCLPVAEEYNLDSSGALAVLFDISVQFGVGGMKAWVEKANLTPGASFDPESILKVIQALPDAHHKRRLHILEEVQQNIRFTW